MNEKEIRFIDLFGGIGGFRLGLERSNNKAREHLQERQREWRNISPKRNSRKSKKPQSHQKPRRSERSNDNRPIHEDRGKNKNLQKHSTNIKSKGLQKTTFNCVWYCDKDKYAVETYNKNFKTSYKPTDIRTIKAKYIPDFDMLCAGFPCQSFSVAGKRKGFKDTGGTLFYEICRIAQAKRPRMLFLENVKGLLSHDEGRTFRTILISLDELGYDVEWQVFNSKNFGVPQNRERVFIIGHLRNQCGQQVFPLRQIDSEYIQNGKKQKRQESAWALRSRDYKDGTNFIYWKNSKEKWIEEKRETTPSLKTQSELCRRPLILSRPHGFNKGNAKDNVNVRFSSIQNETINGIRRLTPIECERLQGFPDNWTEGVSDTQRYKQLGNAVTVNVIDEIGRAILGMW